jgi:hypothetical protein
VGPPRATTIEHEWVRSRGTTNLLKNPLDTFRACGGEKSRLARESACLATTLPRMGLSAFPPEKQESCPSPVMLCSDRRSICGSDGEKYRGTHSRNAR